MDEKDTGELRVITEKILATVNAEEIFLFGSFAYGTPKEDSDFDIYVLLSENSERPLRAMQKINMALARMDIRSVDILADTSAGFYQKCKGPTLERTILSRGVRLYERDEQLYQTMA